MQQEPVPDIPRHSAELRALLDLQDRIVGMQGSMVDSVSEGVEQALRKVLSDPTVRRDFWKAGYDELSGHAGTGAAKWVGQRILSAIGGALLAAGIYLGFKYGGWGK